MLLLFAKPLMGPPKVWLKLPLLDMIPCEDEVLLTLPVPTTLLLKPAAVFLLLLSEVALVALPVLPLVIVVEDDTATCC